MDSLPTVLTYDIADLLGGLDDGPISLLEPVGALQRDMRLAVRSYVGLEMTIVTSPGAVRLIAMEPLAELEAITTSLRLSLAAISRGFTHGSMVAFATTPGAFVDLAAEITFVNRLKSGDLRLDQDLPPRCTISEITGFRELGDANHGIAMLIGRGQDPDQAQAELERLAEQSGTSVQNHARRLSREKVG